jgi:putative ABC transport system substrate-binding protein
MRRRKFITLLGGAAAWPLAARAQQTERMRRIGVLINFASDDPAAQSRLTAFLQGLSQLGWTEGSTVRIDVRWGAGDTGRTRKYAAELVAFAPDIILTAGSPVTGPVLQATRTVPVVSCRLPIRSAAVSSRRSPAPAETPPGSQISNTG